jgi:PTH1 family peptidyl-tRNA hydrolase
MDVEPGPFVVVGLGNPGPDYAGTRHNVGFAVAHRLADALRAQPFDRTPDYDSWSGHVPGEEGATLVVLTPLTFMNASGRALREFGRRFGLAKERILVVVDDVYLPLGTLRLRARGSDGGHNGLESVRIALGSDEFARLRIGVGLGEGMPTLADHVLSQFVPEELPVLNEVLRIAQEAALTWAREGIASAMNRFNAKPRAERDNTPEGER